MSDLNEYILKELESTKNQIADLHKNVVGLLSVASVSTTNNANRTTVYDLIQQLAEYPSNMPVEFILDGHVKGYSHKHDDDDCDVEFDCIRSTVFGDFYESKGKVIMQIGVNNL